MTATNDTLARIAAALTEAEDTTEAIWNRNKATIQAGRAAQREVDEAREVADALRTAVGRIDMAAKSTKSINALEAGS